MKKMNVLIAITAITFLTSFTMVNPISWSLDKAHAKLGFTITHLMVSDVEGSFKTFDAKITAHKDDFSDAIAELTAEVKSIDTENQQRDQHLLGPDFFDADNFPTITFKSKSFTKSTNNEYKVIGDLTMHGITKQIELTAIAKTGTNPMNKKTITGFKVNGVIKRTDFNLSPSTPSAMLGNEVTISANAEFSKD